MPNRLAGELSPYLLQHAENPVDWHPWAEEAFAAARDHEKPIFLSVGYSTCHWCHVMERESFEDPEIARLLNASFVSIKVDREERPDVDRVYMAFVQASTGSGGWPMSVWLTPDLKPFFGGTYFPPASRMGRPGFAEMLQEIARLWNADRQKLLDSADTLLGRLREMRHSGLDGADRPETVVAPVDTLAAGVDQFVQAFDQTHGGFGSAPKFPRPCELLFLLREHHRTGTTQAQEIARRTLGAMADGGMRDHIGGGFHRYAVDAAWRIPHFEKMLYDQAQLALAYLEAGQLTGDARWMDVADDTLRYVARDLTGADGELWSAEDADSVAPDAPPGAPPATVEGAFYVWTEDEIDSVLGVDAPVAKARYGVRPEGNAPQDPLGELAGKNQLYLARDIDDLSVELGSSAWGVEEALVRARQALFEARADRPRPHLDDKVLTAWNGLAIAALARAAHVLRGEARGRRALEAARRAARFANDHLWDAGRLVVHRRFRGGQASIDGYAEDYACLIWGLLELFQVDGDPAWLDWAVQLQARQDELFWDDQHGGWFSTTGEDPSVLLRLKEDYDGAEPSASSVATHNVLTLSHLTGAATSRDRVERSLARFGPRLGHAARIVPWMAAALSQYHAGTAQIVIVGAPDDAETEALWHRVAQRYVPFAVRVPVRPGPSQQALVAHLPFVGTMELIDDRATAYVCTNFACQTPVTDPDQLDRQLQALEPTV